MKTTIRIIAQEINSETGEVLHEESVYEKEICFPKTIRDLGLDHEEQINLLKRSQDSILKAQQLQIDDYQSTCPNCGKKTAKQGKFESDFHSVFTDHKVILQRTRCQCGWRSKISIDGMYGSALHPDLVGLQSQLGAEVSFKKAESLLAARCHGHRTINNHSRLQKTVQHVGELLLRLKKDEQWTRTSANDRAAADALILVIDGAHLPSKDKSGRSFEALTATVYNPIHHVKKDKHHHIICQKTTVASAKQNRQACIKKLTLNACKKEGMQDNTQLTVLSDGAKNCWSVIFSLRSVYDNITIILDWFYIGKKFKHTEHHIPQYLREDFDGAKWFLWHGNPVSSIDRLKEIHGKLEKNKKSLTLLIAYINNNLSAIVNYADRRKHGLVFTSQLAESTVNNLVNERQKHDARMQWSHQGADCILQIRSSLHSNSWEDDWSVVQNMMYREAM